VGAVAGSWSAAAPPAIRDFVGACVIDGFTVRAPVVRGAGQEHGAVSIRLVLRSFYIIQQAL
jgi:hypothetical protein